ncbi:hypothetical protein B0T18DRAFT_333753, partial [Schizothecium vesticola]
KTLAILGATGKQGSSVLSAVLASSVLTTLYPSIRALTRSPTSPAALALLSSHPNPHSANITLHAADLSSSSSTLPPALSGVHTLFAMTVPAPPGPPATMESAEYTAGVTLVDAAIAAGVDTIVWSTLPSYRTLSGGKFPRVAVFEAKARVEGYIRSKQAEGVIKGVFISPGYFFENFLNAGHFFAPKPTTAPGEDEEWVVALPLRRETRIPLVDGGRDVGRFVAGVLEGVGGFVGRTVAASEKRYSVGEIVEALGRGTGKRVVFREVEAGEWETGLRGVVGDVAGVLADAMGTLREVGHYSAEEGEEEDMIRWAVENAAGGEVRTLVEFLADGPKELVGGGELKFAGNGGQ